ncbi:MAG: PD40 domain-containing protein [Salinivirgaceae bacterium]|nr:PD40 domain-containing protein [Salinivirgaceae bacterium]
MNKIILVLFASFLIHSTSINGQNSYASKSKKAIKNYELALTELNNYNFDGCLSYLDIAIAKDDQFIEAYLLKAEVYRSLQDYENECKNLEKTIAINENYFIYQIFNLAVAQWNSGLYEQSKINFTKHIEKGVGKIATVEKAKNYIEKCVFAIELVNHPVAFNPIPISENINNENDQYWPSLSIDGKTLVYTEMFLDSSKRTITGQLAHQEDFYISYYQNENWTQGKALGSPINSSGNEGAQQLSADGTTIVFTGCNRKNGYGKCDIYFSHKTETGWSEPENAGKIINSKYSEKQPSLSSDGRVLYFSSDRPESLGGMDLYKSHKNAYGSWTKAINLGRTINTHYDEVSPFIHPDNETFYFSSNGHKGLGKSDLFITRKLENNQWEKPQNLGYPINTYADEIGLVVDNMGDKAYYSSNINSSSRNIYYFNLPEKAKPKPVSYISGKIVDNENKKALKAELQLLLLKTLDTIMFIESDSISGRYLMCLPIGKNYALHVTKLGYLFKSESFKLSEEYSYLNPYELNIELDRVQPGQKVILENIFFATDSYELLPESNTELLKIQEFLEHNPKISIEIGGHTDNQGDSEYNLSLSEKRAKAVYNYLSAKINSENHITFKGYGEKYPIASNDCEQGKAKNRRTELKIIE